MTEANRATARRVKEEGGRDAVLLENGTTRVLIGDKGGMVPELSVMKEKGFLNAHWHPVFRSNSGDSFDQARHGDFWKAELLYELAGNFPCSPNFGGGHRDGTVEHLPHGWTANLAWKHEAARADEMTGAAWALSTMNSPEAALPLSFRKIDAVVPGESVHYTSLAVENRGDAAAEINIGWHNTIGSPFLQPGCQLSACAERWATPPLGGEFDDTGRLAVDAEFESLARAPTRDGKTCDLSLVPGPIGFTDFATGPVPRSAATGWSAVANPALALVYACFFPGPSTAGDDGIALSFNDLWMQYGGRRFRPWAAWDGGTDRVFCLGTENATGAFANGLAFSKGRRSVLGSPTIVTLPPRSTRTLRYGTLFAPYPDGKLDRGVLGVDGGKGELVLKGAKKEVRLGADPTFSVLRSLEGRSSE